MNSYTQPFPDRPTNYANGIATEYRGFEISDRFVISRNGKVIWDDCISLEQAKAVIDRSLACKPGTPSAPPVLQEPEDDRFTRWMENEAAKELINNEK